MGKNIILFLSCISFSLSCTNNKVKQNGNPEVSKIVDEQYAICFDIDTAFAHFKDVQYLTIKENVTFESDLLSKLSKLINLKELYLENKSSVKPDSLFEALFNLKKLEKLSFFIDQKTIPNSISKLDGLKTITIFGRGTLQIDSGLYEIKGLKNILISGCVPSFTKGIDGLQNLSLIAINDSKINRIPEEIMSSNTEMLDLKNTNISVLPTNICQMKNLKKIILANTPLAKIENYNLKHYKKTIVTNFIRQCLPLCSLEFEDYLTYK